ncbi:MAG: sterol desaturase family protein [Paracoccaceae bacterium]|nr:sterol desaturase family protein [Paracoccaceae bacterium]MDE2913769.1 sterol desaturase family protein [Paracoccaceae bacterium]
MEYEILVRLGVFLTLFAGLASAESLLPRRRRSLPRTGRWTTNIGIVVLDSLTLQLMAIVMPLLAVGAAIDAAGKGWGLFNHLDWPLWLEVLIVVVGLDFVIWGQHAIMHKIPILWRLHRVHHADRDVDVTTAVRFHPVEIALSMIIKIGCVYALGPQAIAVILFEVMLNGMAMFNHANLRIPPRLETWLRLIVVTPDMHRVHHSIHRPEHDTNFGFSLSVWDRLFGTYTPEPADGHESMTLGLKWQNDAPARLGWSLMLPFRRDNSR